MIRGGACSYQSDSKLTRKHLPSRSAAATEDEMSEEVPNSPQFGRFCVADVPIKVIC